MGETCKPDGRTARAISSDFQTEFREWCDEKLGDGNETPETLFVPRALYSSVAGSIRILDSYPDDRAA